MLPQQVWFKPQSDGWAGASHPAGAPSLAPSPSDAIGGIKGATTRLTAPAYWKILWAGGEDVQLHRLHLTDGVPRCPSRTI